MILVTLGPSTSKTMKWRMMSRKRRFSKMPRTSVASSGVPFSAMAEPSTVRQGMKRSQAPVSVPWRASMPSLATSSSLQVNRLGICCL